MIRIFNTLSGKIEPLPHLSRNKPLRIFVCGPTVYDSSHIGHARTYLVFDAFVRFLRANGIKVFYLQNITDIDDKIIARARESRTTPKLVASRFTREHLDDMKHLGITSVNRYARATDFMKEIVKQVERLIAKKFAYLIPGEGYYFEVKKFKDYGKLARRTDMRPEDGVSRIDESIKKRDPRDFCLWKLQKEKDEPAWNTPLGKGRPGWHIEDTAISEKFFGARYDVHGGAIDLIFPHHEAEIAQQESVSGKKPFVKLWMHTGFLIVNGEKMSKSLGNFITIREFLEKYPAYLFRFFILLFHWRSPMNFSEENMEQAEASFETIQDMMRKARLVADVKRRNTERTPSLRPILKELEDNFTRALEDNFNTPLAFGALFTALRHIQPHIFALSSKNARAVVATFSTLLGCLGIAIPKGTIPLTITRQVKKRELFRRNKQFIQSDALRKKIESIGFAMEDTPLGTLIWQKQQKSRPRI